MTIADQGLPVYPAPSDAKSLLGNKKTGTVICVAYARGVDDDGDDWLSSWR